MRIGIAGAHRTGKTTLAMMVAKSEDTPFMQGSVTPVYEHFGVRPSAPLSMRTRLEIQSAILERFIFQSHQRTAFVTDRTPYDFIAYLMAELNSEAALEMMDNRAKDLMLTYLDRCYEAANDCLDVCFVLAPGIAIEQDSTKAVCLPAFVEKIHMLITGSAVDSRVKLPVLEIGRDTLGLDARVKSVRTGLDMVREAKL